MQRGDSFLIGSINGKTKHLWIVLSDTKKHNGCGIMVNASTKEQRSGKECPLQAHDGWKDLIQKAKQ